MTRSAVLRPIAMMALLYDVAVVITAATMVGNEFAVALFVHPQLYKLDEAGHSKTAALLANSLGKVMPFWYGLALLLMAGATYEHRPLTHGPGMAIAAATALWATMIVFTVVMLVPINDRIARLNAADPYARWLEDRHCWDQLHRVRVFVLAAAVVLLLYGLLLV